MKNNNGMQRNDKMGKIALAILMTLTMGNIAMAQRALPETGLSALSVKLADSAKDSSGASSKLSEFFDHSLTRKNKEASPVYLGQQDLNAARTAGHEAQALNNAQGGATVCPGCGGSGPVTAPETRNKSAWEKIRLARPGAVPPPLTTIDTTPDEETKSKVKKNDLAGLNKETSVVGAVVAGAVTGAMVGAVAGGGGAIPGAVAGAIVGGAGAAVSNVVEIIVAQVSK